MSVLTEAEVTTLLDEWRAAGPGEVDPIVVLASVDRILANRLAQQAEQIAQAIEAYPNRTVIINKADAARIARDLIPAVEEPEPPASLTADWRRTEAYSVAEPESGPAVPKAWLPPLHGGYRAQPKGQVQPNKAVPPKRTPPPPTGRGGGS